jgi:hypothetical protein
LFDPTIYENLKVVLEGAVYDLDLAGVILVTNRSDIIDLATMSRSYTIQFHEKLALPEHLPKAELRLEAGMGDLAAEILEEKEQVQSSNSPGCQLEIYFYLKVKDVNKECRRIEELLTKVWASRPQIQQRISFLYEDSGEPSLSNTITMNFGRKIDEQQIEDLPTVVDHMLHSLQALK